MVTYLATTMTADTAMLFGHTEPRIVFRFLVQCLPNKQYDTRPDVLVNYALHDFCAGFCTVDYLPRKKITDEYDLTGTTP